MPYITPEIEYVMDLARAWALDVPGPVPVRRDLDVDRFIRLIVGQPSLQTIIERLDPELLSADDRRSLDQALHIAQRRTTTMLLELDRVLQALGRAGCRPVVLKGGSLAVGHYPRPEQRWFADLDLLVDQGERELVFDTLARLGYRFRRTGRKYHYYEHYHFHHILVSNQGVAVEVHWAITLPNSVYRYDLDALRRRAVEVSLDGLTLRAPHAVDQVLHGVLQGLAGGFRDLRRVLDLHLLEKTLTSADHQELCQRARAGNFATGLWLQYHLREEILGEPIPRSIDEECHPGPSVARVFRRLALVSGCVEGRLRRQGGYDELLHWLCVPSGKRLREIRRYAMPSEEQVLAEEMALEKPLGVLGQARLVGSRVLLTTRLLARLLLATLPDGDQSTAATR